jgi:hypothetical protein
MGGESIFDLIFILFFKLKTMKLFFFILIFSLSNLSIQAQCTLNNTSTSYSSSLSTTGNTTIDNILKTEKTKLESFFNVKADLKICSGSNGIAKKNCQNYNCNGTIELGNHLLIHEYNKQGPITKKVLGKNMVIAIMAHEYAHIFQYNHPELKFKNAVVQEIHADMLAGWYLLQNLMNEYGLNRQDVRYKFNNADKVEFINNMMQDINIAFGWMGDEQYWSPQHHGDYFTRISAFGEAWKGMSGRPVRINCDNFWKWLQDSVWLAEVKLYEEKN